MPIFVVSCLIFAGSPAAAYSVYAPAPEPQAPLTFNLKMGSENTFLQGADVNATLGTTLEYHFLKTYSFGAEYSFYSPYTDFDDYIYNGANDLSFYLSDSELWASKYYGLNLTGKLS